MGRKLSAKLSSIILNNMQLIFRRCCFIVLFIFLVFNPVNFSWAQKVKDTSLLTLDRIFSSKEFDGDKFGPAKWLKDGSGYTTLEDSKVVKGAKDIVRYDLNTNLREIVVPASRLIPQGGSSPLKIADYSWSSDLKRLLIFTNTKRVWRRNTRGDYWVLNLQNWRLKKLGGKAAASTLMFAKFSPDGHRIAYVRENNIYVEDLENNRIVQLTKDGSEEIINGTSDWVYEEEFSLRDGFRWSPDGKLIAFWQLNTKGVGKFYLINYTDSLYPRLKIVKYPKVGTTNSACRIGVASTEDGSVVWLKVPGDARDHYIPRMDWAANSDEIILQRLNRLQNTNNVMLANVYTGKVKTVLTERDEAWVDFVDHLYWLENGQKFTWLSERDGWRHVYLISRSGKKIQLITPGEFDVINIEGIDEKNGWLYYIASPENPTQCYLYRAKLDGSGKEERVTPKELQGYHNYRISPKAKWAFHSYSSFDTPPVTELIRLPQHDVVKTLIANSSFKERVRALKRRPTEFFRVDIGKKILLDGWCMKPYNFNPQKKYPLLFYVYGEPAGSTVKDRWGGKTYLWHLMLTQQGYLVMSIDNRGTKVPRGRTWRKSIYRQIGILASQDQAAAAQAIIKRWQYVDSERIGIWGWSGGGSMSLNMIFRYPDLYRTAMAVAPVSNQLFYDTVYQERYMGLPEDNEKGYREGSPLTYAHQLKGNLLIVHGTGDDNVHFQNTEVLINELIAHNKQFTMMAYPNRTHSISEGKNTRRHLYGLLTWYLKNNLTPGPRSR